MSAKLLFRLALLLFFLAAFFGFERMNLLVSLKYETDGPNECVSHLTQIDLCAASSYCKMLASFCLIAGAALLVWSAQRAPP